MPWQSLPGIIIIAGVFTVIGTAVPLAETYLHGRHKRRPQGGEDKFVRLMDLRGQRINYFREQAEIRAGVFEENFPKH